MKLCPEVARKIVLEYAGKVESLMFETPTLSDQHGVLQLIAEADGGMIPIVTVDEEAEDRRRTRKVLWKEARLCFSRDIKKIKAVFRATLKPIEVVGDLWFLYRFSRWNGNTNRDSLNFLRNLKL